MPGFRHKIVSNSNMKKYIMIFVGLCIVAIVYFSIVKLLEEEKSYKYSFQKKDFVSLENNRFFLNEKIFYPIVVNYLATLQTDGKDIWVRPSLDYCPDSLKDWNADSSQKALMADFTLIKQMGFNTIRTGVEIFYDEKNKARNN